jgi:hypothetical protein
MSKYSKPPIKLMPSFLILHFAFMGQRRAVLLHLEDMLCNDSVLRASFKV